MHKLYQNIGQKLRLLAKAVFIFGAIAAVTIGFVMMVHNKGVEGFVTMFGGVFGSWICSFLIYGFGEHIDDTKRLAGKENEE